MSDKRRILNSLVIPIFIISLMWNMKILEIAMGKSLAFLGIYPLKLIGLPGIITSPLIHASWAHLINNTVPLLILSVGTFYFYRELALKVLVLAWVMVGIWVWCGAREAYHIGASGVVYALASFLFFSGAMRRIAELAAVSLIVIFLYGSMIWGIFPFVPDISWESHLSGGIAGLILAFVFRKEGPQPRQYDFGQDEEITDEEANQLIDDNINK